jgi:outer membrane murein-binding lipoprotein Lpp
MSQDGDKNLHSSLHNLTVLTEPMINEASEIIVLKQTMNEFIETMAAKFEVLTSDVHNLKTEKFDLLAAEIDDLKSKDSYAIGDELKSEINRLKLENTSLLERNLNLLCTVSDLNTKIKDLKNDKMSLMTAIKLLQVDVNVQGETTGSWTEIRSNKKAESKHPTDIQRMQVDLR